MCSQSTDLRNCFKYVQLKSLFVIPSAFNRGNSEFEKPSMSVKRFPSKYNDSMYRNAGKNSPKSSVFKLFSDRSKEINPLEYVKVPNSMLVKFACPKSRCSETQQLGKRR